ncbi:patatin-like phospholipase family protein [Flavobacterium sp. WC2509]|uniref:patatin-like phospholipase family protein n=1 Tax=Flavobacterium sp. WC2509 TaxID=3461406 RepID=UPI004044CEFD
MSSSDTFTTDILAISMEFHYKVKVKWKTAIDYEEKGLLWVKDISDRYNNAKITQNATEILLTETFHFLKVSGVLKFDDQFELALIMKGGGIKGLAYVGALEELTKFHEFDWYAGTSAGAVTALLLACGYTHNDLKSILEKKDFSDFKDANLLKAIYNLVTKSGLYEANSFIDWIDELLALKLDSAYAVKLGHLPKRVTIYASRRDKDALTFDSFNEKNKDTIASYAARCSMSIPFFFTPQKNEGLNVFDGGVQNNFPVEVLLRDNPNSKFIGLYLGREIYKTKRNNIFRDLLMLGTESEDPAVLEKYRDQIIIIDPYPISTYSFKLSPSEKGFLLENGRLAALKYLDKNNFLKKEDFDFEERKIKIEQIRQDLTNKKRKSTRIIFIAILLVSLFLSYTAF